MDSNRERMKASQMSAIAKSIDNQLGSYNNVAKALDEFKKQLANAGKDGNVSEIASPVDAIKASVITQTGILREILSILKNSPVGKSKEKQISASGQQKEMAEAIKKNNKVEGIADGKVKLAPETTTQMSTAMAKATTKAMEASSKKERLAMRTEKLAQSYTRAYQKGGKVAVAAKAGGDLFKTLVKLLPKLLAGLKRILFTILNPAAMVAMFIAKFLPYVIIGIAFLYGVWLGIKDHIKEILGKIPGLIWDGIVKSFELLWEGIKLIGQGIWWCIDKLGDLIAKGLFEAWKYLGEWWDQFKGIISFVADWVKEKVSKFVDQVVGIFDFCKEKVVGFFSGIADTVSGWFYNAKEFLSSTITGIKDKVVGIVTGIKDKVVGVVTGIKDKIVGIFTSIKDKFTGFFGGIKDKFTGFFGGIKSTLANSWLGRKLGFGDDNSSSVSSSSITNVTNNKKDDNDDALAQMTKTITAPMNQMTRLVENQDKLLKNLNMTPIDRDANFGNNMTSYNEDSVIVVPNDNINSTLIQQTSMITNAQTSNNKEFVSAISEGFDRLITTMNDNYANSYMNAQVPAPIPGQG